MIAEDSKAVYVDKAYRSQEHERYLRERGIKNRILLKGYRNRPLTVVQMNRNRLWSGVRSIIKAGKSTQKIQAQGKISKKGSFSEVSDYI